LRNGLRFWIRHWEAAGPINAIIFFQEYGKLSKRHDHETFIDLGAHMGSFSLFAASRNPGRRVYAFEPDPRNFELLLKNIEENGFSSVVPFQIAAAGVSGTLPLSVGPDHHSQHNSLARYDGMSTIDVKTLSLADIFALCKVKKCDFLKMDIEGAEYDVIFNAPRNVLSKVEHLFIECHPLEGRDEKKLQSFLEGTGLFKARIVTIDRYPHIVAERLSPPRRG
jgi:FkbM family methyltransferase